MKAAEWPRQRWGGQATAVPGAEGKPSSPTPRSHYSATYPAERIWSREEEDVNKGKIHSISILLLGDKFLKKVFPM